MLLRVQMSFIWDLIAIYIQDAFSPLRQKSVYVKGKSHVVLKSLNTSCPLEMFWGGGSDVFLKSVAMCLVLDIFSVGKQSSEKPLFFNSFNLPLLFYFALLWHISFLPLSIFCLVFLFLCLPFPPSSCTRLCLLPPHPHPHLTVCDWCREVALTLLTLLVHGRGEGGGEMYMNDWLPYCY